jgi:dihydroneopterin aldolase/2-amino-4-hydroxy-6-hydroxymethyldihydropteridine diphosphokinase/dihydropteroate synthase
MLVNMSSSRPLDQVRIQNLSIHLPHGLGPSAFNLLPPPPCPIVLNVTISLRKDVVPNCVQNDNMNNLGVNYSSVSKGLIALTAQTFAGPWELVRAVGEDVGRGEVVREVDVELGMPKALLNAGAAVYRAAFAAKPISAAIDGAGGEGGGGGELTIQTQECGISNLRVMTIIGLHPHERLAKQALELDLWVKHHDVGKWDHKAVADDIYRVS